MSTTKKKMLINADQPEECRAVVLEDRKLTEYIVEHSSQDLVKGNIYLGVISRVEPAIEAAFVDFGGKKYGFLPFKDVLPDSYLQTGEKKARTRIQDVLVRGQKILVQVVKESRDAKGPSLTNAITIPGRFVVLMVSRDSSGISRKIEDESERKKMKQIVANLGIPPCMGVIIRTAGLGRTKTELQRDTQALLKIWEDIESKVNDPDAKAPSILYEGPDMVVRTVRDHFTNDTSEILVDNPDSFKQLQKFVKLVMPRMKNRIKLYKDSKPLFSQYQVEDQIEAIYQRRVELPSGGSIVIDIGEAMVSIDVNSGKTTGASALEETALKTNLEAAEEICRQLRLRDLGGLIVIDFIDMFQKKNKAAVEKQMKAGAKLDKARVNFSRLSRFGLLEMSRQRLSPPVKEGIFTNCPHCEGTGHVKTESSAALSVIRKIQEQLADDNVKVLSVRVSTMVCSYLLNHKAKRIFELEESSGAKILFEGQDHLEYKNFTFDILERKREEDKIIEQKSRISRDSKPEEEVQEETGEKRKTGRYANSKKGRGPRKTGSRRPGGTRSPRRRPRKYSRKKGEAGSEKSGQTEPVSSEMDSPPKEGGVEPSPPPSTSPVSDWEKEDSQPLENVSRLHEVVMDSPKIEKPPVSE